MSPAPPGCTATYAIHFPSFDHRGCFFVAAVDVSLVGAPPVAGTTHTSEFPPWVEMYAMDFPSGDHVNSYTPAVNATWSGRSGTRPPSCVTSTPTPIDRMKILATTESLEA